MTADPLMDPLRNDDRFKDLAERFEQGLTSASADGRHEQLAHQD
jgi:hypothetical protein